MDDRAAERALGDPFEQTVGNTDRKAALRAQVEAAGREGLLLLFAANKISKMRELSLEHARTRQSSRTHRRRLAHYHRCLRLLEEHLADPLRVRRSGQSSQGPPGKGIELGRQDVGRSIPRPRSGCCWPTAGFVRFLKPDGLTLPADSPPSTSPPREEHRCFNRGCPTSCLYARPGSSSAATPVDLAAHRPERAAGSARAVWLLLPRSSSYALTTAIGVIRQCH